MTGLLWRKSTKCASAACVEVAQTPMNIFVRDSKETHPTDSAIGFTNSDWSSFIEAVKSDKL